MAAKKIEVFQSEYEYLKRFHEENTLTLATITADRDRWKQAYDELMKDYAQLAYRADCYGCKHATDDEAPCEQADFDCNFCNADCPCRECDKGSNYEYIKKEKEN